jgi:glucose-6-phosphate isomerase
MAASSWTPIESHPLQRLDSLFETEPDRLSALAHEVAGIYFDWSKTHLDRSLVEQFVKLTDETGFAATRDALFAGDIVNPSEERAATHVAERGQGNPDDVALASARRTRMRALVDAVEAGAFGQVSAILHIGIGGSVLGPHLLVDGLGRRSGGPAVRFLSNIDGQAFDDAVDGLEPASTLVIAASKTFTTAETLANLDAALDWMRAGDVADPYGQVIAVTAAPEAAVAAGIDESRILPFADSIGGRYSLWSAVGLPAALALGWQVFEELLEGAAEMDRHFRYSDPAANVPLLAGFSDLLYYHKL